MALCVRSLRFRDANASVEALAGIDLEVARGAVCRVLGPHASGKSTLLHCVAGIAPELRPGVREGEISFEGADLTRGRVRDRVDQIAFVFQDFESQLFSTSVELEVAFGPENLGLDAGEVRRRVAEALAQLGLRGFERRAPATLSGGEKQRLAIACALAMRPRLLLLDDPASDLDPLAREQIPGWVRADAGDPCVVWAEPEPESAGEGERVVWLEGGRKRADGRAERVLAGRRESHPDAVPDLIRLFSLLGETTPMLDPDQAARWLRESGWEAASAGAVGGTAAGGRPIVSVRALSHAYPPGIEVLHDVNLEVRAGESVAILGPNGSGKSTLVRCLCGLQRPSAGDVRIGGVPASALAQAEVAGRIGYVTQNPDHQIFAASVRDELVFGPAHRGVPERVWRERLGTVLETLELEGLEERDPFALTKGERQRVAVGAILMNDPAVLVLDEPTTGLDPSQQARLMLRLEKLREQGRAIVMVTHSLRLAARYARRAVLLRGGRVAAEGPAAEILSDPALLEAAGLRPLPITRLGWRLGARAVTPETLARCLHRKEAGLP